MSLYCRLPPGGEPDGSSEDRYLSDTSSTVAMTPAGWLAPILGSDVIVYSRERGMKNGARREEGERRIVSGRTAKSKRGNVRCSALISADKMLHIKEEGACESSYPPPPKCFDVSI